MLFLTSEEMQLTNTREVASPQIIPNRNKLLTINGICNKIGDELMKYFIPPCKTKCHPIPRQEYHLRDSAVKMEFFLIPEDSVTVVCFKLIC